MPSKPLEGASVSLFAFLTGGQEVPPTPSPGWGEASFEVDEDADSLTWKLRVSGLSDITAGHLHLGAIGQNGPIAVPLFAEADEPGPGVSVVDLSGTVDDSDLTGPLAGDTIEDLLGEIAAGRIYINVHTGAFPNGELRGQVLVRSVTAAATTTTTTGPTTTTTARDTTTTTRDGTTTTTGGGTPTIPDGSTTSTTAGGTTTTTSAGGTTTTTSDGGTTTTTADGGTTSTTAGGTTTTTA